MTTFGGWNAQSVTLLVGMTLTPMTDPRLRLADTLDQEAEIGMAMRISGYNVGAELDAPPPASRPVKEARMPVDRTRKHCIIEGCEGAGPIVRGMCRSHYQRWQRHVL